ncbi:GNAT family N-acetyltransferase [Rhodopseudomonas palustris]|uniref:GNAT family N-acetyltransferase n=1 Tax=Rhodopseudomonas TaxID=1073 RepID=UPI002ACEA948|nr:GNAT family N-acetyltransferase [Rhodopseudomonas palustris]WQH01470.1 GNAT family N-acetyltransferase [Rhodopseudomonas palustris]
MNDKPLHTLRPLERADLEKIGWMEAEIAKISFPDDPITDVGFYVKKLEKLFGDKEAATFVAERDGEIVGWSYVSIRRNFITKQPYGDYHSIYIDPSQRGSGLSNLLMNSVFDWCKAQKLDHVVFRTRATNEPMKGVLARVGFVPTQIYLEKPLKD